MRWMVGKPAGRRKELTRGRAWLLGFYFFLAGSTLSISFWFLPVRTLDVIPSVTKPVALDTQSYERAATVVGQLISISSGYHNSLRQRTVLSLTCTPPEIERLYRLVDQLLNYKPYDAVFDAIHVVIPRTSLRFNESYPTSKELQQRLEVDRNPRVIVHRTNDAGPLTRYIAPVLYERHPDTRIVIIDVDSQGMEWQRRGARFYSARLGAAHSPIAKASDSGDLRHLIYNSQKVDTDAVWCLQGEDFVVDEGTNIVHEAWETFPLQTSGERGKLIWNQVHFCRATGGVLVKPRHFHGFQYNQTSYHSSCFWDDDRWIGFQMERLGTQLKVLHPEPSGDGDGNDAQHRLQRRRLGALSGLTELNRRLDSQQGCTLAWMTQHPESFPTARSHG